MEVLVLAAVLVVGVVGILEHVLSFYDSPSSSQRIQMPTLDNPDQRGMQLQGDVIKFPELDAIVTAILEQKSRFSVPDNPHKLKVRNMGSGGVCGVDHEGHRYVAQDSTKKSAEAKRVRDGAKIVWVIKTHKGGKALAKGLIIGRIEDGKVFMR